MKNETLWILGGAAVLYYVFVAKGTTGTAATNNLNTISGVVSGANNILQQAETGATGLGADLGITLSGTSSQTGGAIPSNGSVSSGATAPSNGGGISGAIASASGDDTDPDDEYEVS
jgi:hypothetical protein